MSNIILNNSPDFTLDVDSKFIYNFYSENETQSDDSIILDNNVNFYKAININVKARTTYDNRLKSFYDNIETSDIESLNNKNLNNDTLFYFNHFHKLDINLINLNYDTDNSHIDMVNKYYNISSTKYEIAKKFISANKKISVNKNFEDEFLSLNYFNEYLTQKNLNDYKFYKTNLDKEIVDYAREVDSIVINENFNVFRKKSIYSSNKIENYYINIGFLIEKYKKEGENFSKLSTYFKYNKQNEDIPSFSRTLNENTIDYSFNLKDNAVKYGKTYKYVIYPVFLTSLSSRLDYHLIDEFIVCGYPYITQEIECKEIKRPIPPSQIYFKYVQKNNSLKISWTKPLEEQGDVKGYQIFKRHSLSDPYVLIKQLEFHNRNDFYTRNEKVSSFIVEKMEKENDTFLYDKNFRKEKIQIYAICSIDAHGFISNYSSQYAVKYNSYTKKCEVDLVSSSGAPLHMPNLLLPRKTKFFENEDYIVNNMPVEEKVKKFTLYVTPEYNKLNIGTQNYKSVLLDNYKLSIFKLENSEVFTDDITIKNFNNENFI